MAEEGAGWLRTRSEVGDYGGRWLWLRREAVVAEEGEGLWLRREAVVAEEGEGLWLRREVVG